MVAHWGLAELLWRALQHEIEVAVEAQMDGGLAVRKPLGEGRRSCLRCELMTSIVSYGSVG